MLVLVHLLFGSEQILVACPVLTSNESFVVLKVPQIGLTSLGCPAISHAGASEIEQDIPKPWSSKWSEKLRVFLGHPALGDVLLIHMVFLQTMHAG